MGAGSKGNMFTVQQLVCGSFTGLFSKKHPSMCHCGHSIVTWLDHPMHNSQNGTLQIWFWPTLYNGQLILWYCK